MPSGTSSLYHSATSSTVSRTPSVDSESVYSPVQTEITHDFSHPPHAPLDQSPLRKSILPLANVPQKTTSAKHGLKLQRKSGNPHVCLWGADEVCVAGSFGTREELNRHVKMEHLLECPVPGCTENAFDNRDFLACHMKHEHKESDATETTSQAAETRNLHPFGASNSEGRGALSAAQGEENAVDGKNESTEDRILEMETSIDMSKKRCREKLRAIREKRRRRAEGTSQPRNADSPGASSSSARAPNPLETTSFPVVWEHAVLPFLVEFLPKWCGPEHVISVLQGSKPGSRRVAIMTRRLVRRTRRIIIAGHVRDLLPEPYRSNVTFVFSVGKVERLVWARGLSKEMPDEICAPHNPFAYISPCMGDSIGATLEGGEETTATLGPCITAEGGSYWLACFHPFIGDNRRTSPISIEHPSPEDRAMCEAERHDVMGGMNFRLGNLTATSGYDLKTTRVTHDPYWAECDLDPPLVVMDWTLISSGSTQANLLRRFPKAAQRRETPIIATSSVMPGANVISTGRTSGFGRGRICEVPAYVTGKENGTGKNTREWFVQQPYSQDDEDEWIRGGIGVAGDSGAAIIDSDTNTLVGQLWGRDRYWGPGVRVTFFTPISDIFDDIHEKCGMASRPQLPQDRDEADCWPVYPVCRQCYDLREYQGSRRSSRESVMSMIGLCDVRDEADHELSSISELATPKDHHSYSVRHMGPDEAGWSCVGGGSAVSPAPIHGVFSALSPAASEMRSPYPQTLNDEDLYESQYPQARGGTVKRPSRFLAPEQGGTQHWAKRPRVTEGDGTRR
ncbi:hypothetical protein F5Y17DRAFT_468365 [Xylariaceae sp. FL0594]|nr:hypothetical protein F5Y17DRAFT_468365 [Xylariaceae sp. FL0594]